mmetsp:Transcript_2737/g.6765  ORF Transcript_2737/g.6765 Transcript_2737/m.6765 type:complete len:246 (+) Transcript_2737:368-1105(+)
MPRGRRGSRPQALVGFERDRAHRHADGPCSRVGQLCGQLRWSFRLGLVFCNAQLWSSAAGHLECNRRGGSDRGVADHRFVGRATRKPFRRPRFGVGGAGSSRVREQTRVGDPGGARKKQEGGGAAAGALLGVRAGWQRGRLAGGRAHLGAAGCRLAASAVAVAGLAGEQCCRGDGLLWRARLGSRGLEVRSAAGTAERAGSPVGVEGSAHRSSSQCLAAASKHLRGGRCGQLGQQLQIVLRRASS